MLVYIKNVGNADIANNNTCETIANDRFCNHCGRNMIVYCIDDNYIMSECECRRN